MIAETTEGPSVAAIVELLNFIFRIYGPVFLIIAIGVAIYLLIKKIFGFKSPEPFDDTKNSWIKSIMTVEQGVRSTGKALDGIILLSVFFVIMWIRMLLWAARGF